MTPTQEFRLELHNLGKIPFTALDFDIQGIWRKIDAMLEKGELVELKRNRKNKRVFITTDNFKYDPWQAEMEERKTEYVPPAQMYHKNHFTDTLHGWREVFPKLFTAPDFKEAVFLKPSQGY